MASNASSFKVRNFRCIVPLRQSGAQEKQLLFRSSKLDAADQSTVDHLRNQLGVRTIIDFRSLSPASDALNAAYKPVTLSQFRQAKAADKSNTNGYHVFNPFINAGYVWELTKRQPYSMYPQVASWSFRYFVLGDETVVKEVGSHTARTEGLLQSYHDFMVGGKEVVRSTLEILSDPENVPAIICCQLGKDRTGVSSALVLSILGHTVDEIADDYHVTESEIDPVRESMVKHMKEDYGVDASYLDAKKEGMVDFLKWMADTFGSVEGYLNQAGVDDKLREKLRKTLNSKI